MFCYLIRLIVGVPLYILLYGGEHLVEKLCGRRGERDWLGRLKYVQCLSCNEKIPLGCPQPPHICPSRR